MASSQLLYKLLPASDANLLSTKYWLEFKTPFPYTPGIFSKPLHKKSKYSSGQTRRESGDNSQDADYGYSTFLTTISHTASPGYTKKPGDISNSILH